MTGEGKETGLTCPTLTLGYLIKMGANEPREFGVLCIKERCAFWNSQPIAGCAILSLGEAAKATAIRDGVYS